MLEQTVTRFLKKYHDPKRPLLVALSGGPDSMALFHLLLQANVLLAVAHIDHCWRKDSGEQATQLKAVAQEMGIPFHLKTLAPPTSKKNLEDQSRKDRLKFFHTLCQEYGYQSVACGHQADDQAETVLKRVFEGAHLITLAGIRPVSEVEGVTFWRPLLPHRKKDIFAWLKKKGISFFLDETNEDTHFLRNRSRQVILPHLSSLFGKEVDRPLCRLAKEAEALNAYLQRKVAPYLEKIQKGEKELILDLSDVPPLDPIELHALLREVFRLENLTLSRTILETLGELLLSGAADKRVHQKGREIRVDRKRLFFSLDV